jgi:hypothetical protein
VIVLAVRWYLRFGLSYRDVEELLAVRPMRGLKQDRSARPKAKLALPEFPEGVIPA